MHQISIRHPNGAMDRTSETWREFPAFVLFPQRFRAG